MQRTAVFAVAFWTVLSGASVAQTVITRTASFSYHGVSGQLTQEVVEPDIPSMRLVKSYSYDTFGNKIATTVNGADITPRTETTEYDTARGQFVTTKTNALAHSESWLFDARFGKPTRQAGPNGLVTRWVYDRFGRKAREIRADGNRTEFEYEFCSGVNGGMASCPDGGAYLVRTIPQDVNLAQNGPIGTVYFDMLDREVGRDTQGFDGGTVRALREYDAFGRVRRTSRPFFLSGGTPRWTVYTHDALDRVISAAAPDGGVTTHSYSGLVSVETNALLQKRTITKNMRGEVIAVKDALNKVMTYEYDPVGNLVKTTDALGNVVTAQYDLRGRKIETSDPNLGTWTYTHDVLGNVITQTDAKFQTTTFTYDLLNRLVERSQFDMTSVWVYDTATKGIGKIASANITAGPGAGFQRAYEYDDLGRLLKVASTIDGTTYSVRGLYNPDGRLHRVIYPSGFSTRYVYNSLGYSKQLLDHVTGQVHWTVNELDAEQHILQQTAGNGLVTTRTFSDTTGRLLSIRTQGSVLLQLQQYTHDLIGNLTARDDVRTGVAETFGYDALNRLTSATMSVNMAPGQTKNYTYDAIGNLQFKSDVGNYHYPAAGQPRPHAVTSITGGVANTTFTYDANGNQETGLGRTTTWTSYNKPASITQGARTISFVDDVDYQRFKQVTPDGTTLYFEAFGVRAELVISSPTTARWNEYLSVGNQLVGVRFLDATTETVTTRYFHTDHLGSVSVITDEAASLVRRLAYDPWGKRRFNNGDDDPSGSLSPDPVTTVAFTGEEELSIGGFIHLNGRVYDPMLGRMTSADPLVPDPMNPQAWNRYSYVGNSPLVFTDPSGHSWLSNFFSAIGNFFKSILSNPIVRAVVQIVIAALLPVTPILAGAISAAVVTGLSGGKLGDVVKNGLIALGTAVLFVSVGNITGHTPAFGSPQHVANIAGHAGVGCVSAVASGGKCASGALSAAVGSVVAPGLRDIFPDPVNNPGHRLGGAAASAVFGGLASVAGGGKFENGAVTAAFGYLFNAAAGCMRNPDPRACPVVEGGVGGAGGSRGNIEFGLAATATATWIGDGVKDWLLSVIPGGAEGSDSGVRVHGNSYRNMQGTEVYYLINNATGDIDKIGITSYGEARYPQSYYESQNVTYVTQAQYDWRLLAAVDEYTRLRIYQTTHGGSLPRLNEIPR